MNAYTIAELKTRNVVSLAADAAVIGGARVRAAMSLMGYVHDGQYRKEPRMGADYVDPYSIHPLRVMLRLYRLLPVGLAIDDVLVAALLHDALEDGPAQIIGYYSDAPSAADTPARTRDLARRDLTEHFGPRVAAIIGAVTNPLEMAELTGDAKRAAYTAHLRETVLPNAEAAYVKASDLVDNAGSLIWMTSCADKQRRLAAKYDEPVDLMLGSVHLDDAASLKLRMRKVRRDLDQILGR